MCESKVCLVPEQMLHTHFLCFFSSNLTGDVFKCLGCWSAILEIVNHNNENNSKESQSLFSTNKKVSVQRLNTCHRMIRLQYSLSTFMGYWTKNGKNYSSLKAFQFSTFNCQNHRSCAKETLHASSLTSHKWKCICVNYNSIKIISETLFSPNKHF